MRLLLVLTLIHGLVPALGEVVEAVVHYAVEGHLAHSDADAGDLGDQGCEHGCGTTDHRCQCCSSQVLAAPARTVIGQLASVAAASPATDDTFVGDPAPSPPFRPPIAS
jgi:hypothetical protein